jgi:hypothetical protein
LDRPQKLTFAEMREIGVRGILIYCADYRSATRSPSAAMHVPTTSGYPTSKSGLCAGPAASAVRTCGHFRAVQGFRYYGQKGLDA